MRQKEAKNEVSGRYEKCLKKGSFDETASTQNSQGDLGFLGYTLIIRL